MMTSRNGRGPAPATLPGPEARGITPGELAIVVTLLRARAARSGEVPDEPAEAGGQVPPTWRSRPRRRIP